MFHRLAGPHCGRRRHALHWRPASSLESFEIVRRRLFADPDATAPNDIAAVARQYVRSTATTMASSCRGERNRAYEEWITAAYPIHPELLERLYWTERRARASSSISQPVDPRRDGFAEIQN